MKRALTRGNFPPWRDSDHWTDRGLSRKKDIT